MPLTLSGNGTISDLASAPTVGGTALPTNLSDLGIANHDQIAVDSSGSVSTPNQPYIVGYINSDGVNYTRNATGTQTLPFLTLNSSGNYLSATGQTFTAPVAGLYVIHLTYGVLSNGTAATTSQITININGTARPRQDGAFVQNSGWANRNISIAAYLQENDNLSISLNNGGAFDVIDWGSVWSSFSIYKTA